MRYILSILLLISLSATAQQPTGNPTLYNNKWYRYTQFLGVDSALLVGSKDTSWTPRQPAIVLWEHAGVDTALWLYDKYWRKISGGSSTNLLPLNNYWTGNNSYGSVLFRNFYDTSVHATLGYINNSSTIHDNTSIYLPSVRNRGFVDIDTIAYRSWVRDSLGVVKYTDTASMLSAYQTSLNARVRYTDSTTKYVTPTQLGNSGYVKGSGVVQAIPFWNGTRQQSYTNNLTIDSTTGRTYAYLYQTTGGNYKPLSSTPSSPSLGYSIYSRANNGITQLYGLDSLGKESRLTPVGASAINTTGSTIAAFTPICLDSTSSVAVAKGSYIKFFPFAVTQDAIANNGYGRIVYNGGTVTGMSLGAYQNGATLYLADGGGLSTTPSTTYPAVRIGIVTSNTLGNMLVAIGNVPKDSLNAVVYVPYTGATTTLDMGSNAVNAQAFKVNGTGGNGHVDLKWQSADAPSISNSTAIYADASGNFKFKLDGNYTNTLSVSANTANRTYTFPDRNVTLDNITTSTTTGITGLLKGNGSVVSAATSGAANDYLVGGSLSATRNVSTGSIFTYNSSTGAYNLDTTKYQQPLSAGTNITISSNTVSVASSPTFSGSVTISTPANTTGSAATVDGTQTLSNKRWKARVGSTTSSATPTINTDNYDIYKLTAQAADITSFTTNLSGTPNDGDILEIQITGTASRALTFGSSFVSSSVSLPTTTSGTNTLTIVFQYFTNSSYGSNKWVCFAVN